MTKFRPNCILHYPLSLWVGEDDLEEVFHLNQHFPTTTPQSADFCQVLLQCLHKPWERLLLIGQFLLLKQEKSFFSYLLHKLRLEHWISTLAQILGFKPNPLSCWDLAGFVSRSGVHTMVLQNVSRLSRQLRFWEGNIGTKMSYP